MRSNAWDKQKSSVRRHLKAAAGGASFLSKEERGSAAAGNSLHGEMEKEKHM